MRVRPLTVLLAGSVLFLLFKADVSAEPALEIPAVELAEQSAEPNLRLSLVRIVETAKPLVNGQSAAARRKDSSANGALIGAAIGAGYGIAVAMNVEPENDPAAMIIMSTSFGLLAGWIIDELR